MLSLSKANTILQLHFSQPKWAQKYLFLSLITGEFSNHILSYFQNLFVVLLLEQNSAGPREDDRNLAVGVSLDTQPKLRISNVLIPQLSAETPQQALIKATYYSKERSNLFMNSISSLHSLYLPPPPQVFSSVFVSSIFPP